MLPSARVHGILWPGDKPADGGPGPRAGGERRVRPRGRLGPAGPLGMAGCRPAGTAGDRGAPAPAVDPRERSPELGRGHGRAGGARDRPRTFLRVLLGSELWRRRTLCSGLFLSGGRPVPADPQRHAGGAGPRRLGARLEDRAPPLPETRGIGRAPCSAGSGRSPRCGTRPRNTDSTRWGGPRSRRPLTDHTDRAGSPYGGWRSDLRLAHLRWRGRPRILGIAGDRLLRGAGGARRPDDPAAPGGRGHGRVVARGGRGHRCPPLIWATATGTAPPSRPPRFRTSPGWHLLLPCPPDGPRTADRGSRGMGAGPGFGPVVYALALVVVVGAAVLVAVGNRMPWCWC